MDGAVERFHRSLSVVDKQALISVRVLEEVVHLLSDKHLVPLNVVVAHQALSTRHGITERRQLRGLKVSMMNRLFLKVLRRTRAQIAPRTHLRRLIDVIQGRTDVAESVRAKQLLRVEPAIRLAELDMMLFRKLSEVVVAHDFLFVESFYEFTATESFSFRNHVGHTGSS